MDITVKGKQLDVGEALRGRIEEHLPVLIEKYFAHAIEAEVVLSKSNHLFRCDVDVHVGRNIRMNAFAEADDAHAAFERAADRITKRLRRYKRRLKDHHKNYDEASRIAAQSFVLEAEPEEIGDHHEEPHEPMVVAEMETVIESLTPSEAVMRLDFGELPALMFRNRAHGGLNMIYRRPDGNIGWVNPMDNPGAGG